LSLQREIVTEEISATRGGTVRSAEFRRSSVCSQKRIVAVESSVKQRRLQQRGSFSDSGSPRSPDIATRMDLLVGPVVGASCQHP
jgi:hypothetical protein